MNVTVRRRKEGKKNLRAKLQSILGSPPFQPHIGCSRCATQRLFCAFASVSRLVGTPVVRDRGYPVVCCRGCRRAPARERESRLRLSCRGGERCGAFPGGSAAAPFFCARVQRASTTEHFLHPPSTPGALTSLLAPDAWHLIRLTSSSTTAS